MSIDRSRTVAISLPLLSSRRREPIFPPPIDIPSAAENLIVSARIVKFREEIGQQ